MSYEYQEKIRQTRKSMHRLITAKRLANQSVLDILMQLFPPLNDFPRLQVQIIEHGCQIVPNRCSCRSCQSASFHTDNQGHVLLLVPAHWLGESDDQHEGQPGRTDPS